MNFATGMVPQRFVLDASVALAWFLPDTRESVAYSNGILAGVTHGRLAPAVPEFWHYEVGSVLLSAKRDRRIGAAKLRNALAMLEGLQAEVFAVQLSVSEVVETGMRYHLQGYDAIYFELALRLGVAIASLDRGIRTACVSHRVHLLSAELSDDR